jgi:tetratricopeptide (TPR) repeat protein
VSPLKVGIPFFASDRYAYVPMIGLVLGIITVVQWLCSARKTQHMRAFCFRKAQTAALALMVIFSLMTINQSLMWGDSVKLYERVTKAYPDFYLGYISLGASYRIAKRYDDAIAAYQKAIDIKPIGNTYGLIAQISAETNHLSLAVAQFTEAIKMDPTDPELHYGLGQVYALMNDTENAMKEYETALSVAGTENSAYQRLARRIATRKNVIYARIGELYGKQGNDEKALEYYQKAITEDPYYADAYFNVGIALGNSGRTAEAIAAYEKAVQLAPVHLKARMNLAIMYFRQGEKQKSKKELQTILKIDPTAQDARDALQKMEANGD